MNANMAESFVPSDGAARWARGLLFATLALAIVGIISGLLQCELVSRGVGGISDAEASANDARQQIIGILQMVAMAANAVAFLVWFHRVHKNLPALQGRELKYTSGWAIGGFFVPILNLFRPLQVMREVWHGSNPTTLERDQMDDGPMVRNQLGTPALVGFWWGLFLTASFLGNLIFRLALSNDHSIDDLQRMTFLLVASDVLDVPAVLVAVRLIGRITEWQSLRMTRIRQFHAEPA